jgi:hypothetical protein
MDKNALLQKYIDMESHNLLCYSENYGMTKPKPGHEQDWSEAKARITGLEGFLKDADTMIAESKTPECALSSEKLQLMQKYGVQPIESSKELICIYMKENDLPEELYDKIHRFLKMWDDRLRWNFYSEKLGLFSLSYLQRTPIEELKSKWEWHVTFMNKLNQDNGSQELGDDAHEIQESPL